MMYRASVVACCVDRISDMARLRLVDLSEVRNKSRDDSALRLRPSDHVPQIVQRLPRHPLDARQGVGS
jgi:hypothetical protein